MDIYEECLAYFRQKGFRRALEGIYEKYYSLSRLGGNIYIDDPLPEERDVLSRFLRQDFSGQDRIKISLRDFEKKLKDTKFEDFDLIDILEAILNKKALTQKEAADIENKERQNLLQGLIDDFSGTIAADFIQDIIKNPQEYKMIYVRMNDKIKLKKELFNVCKALISLPKEHRLRLPVFAANITTDPHYFDYGNDAGRLLIKALSYINKCTYPSNAEERSELLYDSGILIDEVSNQVLVNGLLAYNGEIENSIWSAALIQKEPMAVTLYNLNKVDRIISPRGYLMAVENPSVFSALTEYDPELPCICVNGQPKLAVLIVLKLLNKSECSIYYSGDFDPEGLLIAERLLSKFNRIKLCCMDIKRYKMALSNKKIEEKRLKSLDNIQNPDLKILAREIEIRGFAGYQEKVISEIVEFIESIGTR